MFLIDKKGARPVCAACKKAAKRYGIVVKPGQVYVCQECLKTPGLYVPVPPRVRAV